MALIDRIAKDVDGHVDIPAHPFSAAVYLWLTGSATRAKVITAFSLDATDEVQLDQLEAHYSGQSTAWKAGFHGKLEACCILLQEGHMTKAQVKAVLEMT